MSGTSSVHVLIIESTPLIEPPEISAGLHSRPETSESLRWPCCFGTFWCFWFIIGFVVLCWLMDAAASTKHDKTYLYLVFSGIGLLVYLVITAFCCKLCARLCHEQPEPLNETNV